MSRPLTNGPHAGDPPTVLQSADVVELNRALAQRDARIAELEWVLRAARLSVRHAEYCSAEDDGGLIGISCGCCCGARDALKAIDAAMKEAADA